MIQLPFQSYKKNVYRNIFFCPAQDIYDDICDKKEEEELIDSLVQLTSGVDHQVSAFNRPFQYGLIEDSLVVDVFKKDNWRGSRFSDGTEYGIWYGAEDKLTSIYETCWWAYLLGKDNVFRSGEVYTTDRVMYRASVRTEKMTDLTSQLESYEKLIDPFNYQFCQSLGKKFYHEGGEVLRTFSARREKGVCTPIFSKDVISKAEILFYFTYYIRPDETIVVSSSHDGVNFSLKSDELILTRL